MFCLSICRATRERGAFRFAEQQVNVLGHDDVPETKNPYQRRARSRVCSKTSACVRVRQQRPPMMTAEGYEVETACLLEALESQGMMPS